MADRGRGSMVLLRRIASLLVMLTLIGCSDDRGMISQGEAAPAFLLQTLDGRTISYPEDCRGKVVAIRFWADWCPYCKGEMKALQPAYQKYADRGLMILAINVMQSPEAAAAFVRALDISYEVLLDPKGEVTRRYGVWGLPTTFFLDRQGVIQAKIHGESTPEVFEQVIEELIPESRGGKL